MAQLRWLLILVMCSCSVAELEPEQDVLASQVIVPVEEFRDDFNGANNANITGLNDNLAVRQASPLAPTTYTRVPGLWYPAPPPSIWLAQVNHIYSPDVLSFHGSTTALRLNKLISRDASGAFRLSFVTEPVVWDARDDFSWTSVMLSSSQLSNGYVSSEDVDFGFAIRSNGWLLLFNNGHQVTLTPGNVPPADRYEVSLEVRDGQVLGSVNGVLFTGHPSGPGALPTSAYLYLGAYLEQGQVSRFDDLVISPVVNPIPVREFRDDFDGANNANITGLNDNLAVRQAGSQAPATYTRVSGLWYPAPPPSIWLAQVNHIYSPDTLSFHGSTTALRLNQQVSRDASGAFRLSFVTEPVVWDARDDFNWTSVMLSSSQLSNGYVSSGDVDFGFAIRSNGWLLLFDNGQQVTLTPGNVPPADRYEVNLAVRDGQVLGSVNGVSFTGHLSGPGALPTSAYLYLGAYLEQGQVSRFDDLAISPVVNHLNQYGYYWAQSISYGSHLDEVTGYTNLNFAQGADDLAACAARGVKCLLEARWQFFISSTLRPDYMTAWNQLVTVITPYISSVGGFYVIDEPYWNGVSVQDLETCVNTIKDTFPNIPVMVVHATPSVTPSLVTPARVDWVGFDHYGPIPEVVSYLNTLRATLSPSQKIWLVPPTFINYAYATDAALARVNLEYYDLARNDPRIYGLLNFGLWTGQAPATIPQALSAQESIGRDLLRGSRQLDSRPFLHGPTSPTSRR